MKSILIYLVAPVLLIACTDKFEEFNTDTKNPSKVSGEALFTNAEVGLTDQVSSTNVNVNVFKLFAQYWNETTYTDETNYNIVTRNIPDYTFLEYYTGNDADKTGGFLQDFKVASEIISSTPTNFPLERTNKLAIIELLTVYSYQNLVDIFGNVPYSEALDIENIDPVYDDAATIYQDLLRRVNSALDSLDATAGSFGSADVIYEGDVAMWRMFANSLKLKLGITLADVDPVLSRTVVESAVAGGVFASSADNAELPYLSAIHINPLYEDLVQSGRDDFVPANTIVDIMNSRLDPRRQFYFTPIGGVYRGGTYGNLSTYAQFSHIADRLKEPDFPGILLTYDEVQFYLAEAAARGYTVGGTPQQFYNQAITASILWWGGTAVDAGTYLTRPDVAYTSPGSGATWQQKIGTQAYIAFYTRGLEAWTEWRRLDYPVLNVPPNVRSNPPVPSDYLKIPKRFTYPINEQTLNAQNYQAASDAIGGDELTTRIFWDVKDPELPVVP